MKLKATLNGLRMAVGNQYTQICMCIWTALLIGLDYDDQNILLTTMRDKITIINFSFLGLHTLLAIALTLNSVVSFTAGVKNFSVTIILPIYIFMVSLLIPYVIWEFRYYEKATEDGKLFLERALFMAVLELVTLTGSLMAAAVYLMLRTF